MSEDKILQFNPHFREDEEIIQILKESATRIKAVHWKDDEENIKIFEEDAGKSGASSAETSESKAEEATYSTTAAKSKLPEAKSSSTIPPNSSDSGATRDMSRSIP